MFIREYLRVLIFVIGVLFCSAFVGCGGDSGGGGGGEPVSITIENPPSVLYAISVHSSKPANSQDADDNVLAGAGFTGGSNTSNILTNGAGGTFNGGTVYIVIYGANNDYVSKSSYNLSGGNNVVGYTNNFELLPESGGGSGNFTLTNPPSSYGIIVTSSVLSNSSSMVGLEMDFASKKASGQSVGGAAVLSWTGGNTGTFNVFIYTMDFSTFKYQNGVSFSGGSASLNWNTMTVGGGM